MYIDQDGIRLNAVLDRPDGAARGPLCLVIHGFTGHSEEPHIRAVAAAVNGLGVPTLRLDMYGHGKSGGTFREHTLYKWLTGVLAAADWARAQDFVTDLILCGHSQGGLTAMLAAAMLPDRVRALIPLSPACTIPEDARRGELLGVRFDPARVPETVGVWEGEPLGGNYVRVAQTIRVDEAIDRYPGPVLIVHGDADETVPFRAGEEAAARYARGTLVRIPGDDHCYTRRLPLVTEAVTRWLRPLL